MTAIARILASLTFAAFAAGSACAAAAVVDQKADQKAEPEVSPFKAMEFGGIETILLDKTMVNFRVAMKGARTNEDVAAYARCAAAQYALIRGAVYTQHVRTNVDRKRGVWLGDAIYMISATLPVGPRIIDAKVELRDCGLRADRDGGQGRVQAGLSGDRDPPAGQ